MIIYCAKNLANSKVYIGKTVKSLECRRQQHAHASRRGSNLLFHRAIRKYGEKAFEWFILEHADRNNINALEIHHIAAARATDRDMGYNLTKGGEGGDTWTHAEDSSRRRDRASLFFRSITRNTTWRNRISASNLGRVVSAETREKLRNANACQVNRNVSGIIAYSAQQRTSKDIRHAKFLNCLEEHERHELNRKSSSRHKTVRNLQKLRLKCFYVVDTYAQKVEPAYSMTAVARRLQVTKATISAAIKRQALVGKRYRFTRDCTQADMLMSPVSKHCRAVIATKSGLEYKFHSVTEASEALKISPMAVVRAARGGVLRPRHGYEIRYADTGEK